MEAFKKNTFPSNLFLIGFSFIMSYPGIHTSFLDPS